MSPTARHFEVRNCCAQVLGRADDKLPLIACFGVISRLESIDFFDNDTSFV